MSQRPSAETSSPRTVSGAPAITTPFWDGFLSGGLAIVGMVAVLFYRFVLGADVRFSEGEWIALALLINSPHFMASNVVLYQSKASLRSHPWSTLVVPAVLLCVWVACAWVDEPAPIIEKLILVSSVYLAWHYAGQSWGMLASFSHLAGVRYNARERFLLRSGSRTLIALHVLFAMSGRMPPRQWIDPATYVAVYTWAFFGVIALVVLTFVAGVWAFKSAHDRGEPVPLRAVLPWASLFLWYPFWYFIPGGFMWVQLAHSLQYLSFPIRVELNRHTARNRAEGEVPKTVSPPSSSAFYWRAGLTYLGFVGLGLIVLHGPPLVTRAIGEGWWSTADARMQLMVLTHCVGIHHYFVDGSIWHIRNASVRADLFSHVGRE